jgi:hypothetical protein
MSRGTPVTGRRGVQLAVLALAAYLLVTAFFLATTGSGHLLTPICLDPPSGPSPGSFFAAAWRAVIGIGLIGVALRDLRGPLVSDPILIGLVLAFAGLSLLGGAAGGLADGVLRIGANRCIEIGAPWAYAYSAFLLVAGGVALFAAVAIVLRRGGPDD